MHISPRTKFVRTNVSIWWRENVLCLKITRNTFLSTELLGMILNT